MSLPWILHSRPDFLLFFNSGFLSVERARRTRKPRMPRRIIRPRKLPRGRRTRTRYDPVIHHCSSASSFPRFFDGVRLCVLRGCIIFHIQFLFCEIFRMIFNRFPTFCGEATNSLEAASMAMSHQHCHRAIKTDNNGNVMIILIVSTS